MDFELLREQRPPESQALAHIRRESLDLYNRLHSIQDDIEFVNFVRGIYPDLPLLRESAVARVLRVTQNYLSSANLLCGAWYTGPVIVR